MGATIRAVATAVLSLAAAGCGTEASTGSTKPAPVTSSALVAVALEHIELEPSSTHFFEPGEDVGPKALGGQLQFWGNGLNVTVAAGPGKLKYDLCEMGTCGTERTRAGDVTVMWQDLVEDNPGAYSVVLQLDDEYRYAFFEGVGVNGDPRKDDLPIDVDELVAAVTDERFALESTEGAVALGEKIEKNPPNGPTLAPGETPEPPPESTDFGELVELVASPLDDAVGGNDIVTFKKRTFREPAGPMRDGWGLVAILRHGYRMHVTLLSGTGPGFLQCQPTLTCWKHDGLVLAGRDGLAGVFRSDDTVSAHVWLEGPGVAPTGPDDFVKAGSDRVGRLLGAMIAVARDDDLHQ